MTPRIDPGRTGLMLPRFALAIVFLVLGAPLASSPAHAGSGDVVISQVYGGRGNSGATWRNDFIELFNSGDTPVDLTGWSVQYASATGSTWSVTTLRRCH